MNKKIGISALIALALINTGCQIDTYNEQAGDLSSNTKQDINVSKGKDGIKALLTNWESSQLTESTHHSMSVLAYKTVILHLDLTVCDVLFEAGTDENFSFDQQASNKDLLATLKSNEKGEVLELYLENQSTDLIDKGNKTSRAKVTLPVGPTYILEQTVDVGDVGIAMDQLSFQSIESDVNVGAITLTATQSQPDLKRIILKQDVGGQNLFLSDSPMLETVEMGSNVGSIAADFSQRQAKGFKMILASEVGDIDLTLSKDQGAIIDATIPEFTSDMVINNREFSKDDTVYTLKGLNSESDLAIDMICNVGAIKIHSK